MINDDRIHRCACKARGLRHVWTVDASSRHTLVVDPENAHLLRDASWSVSKMHQKSKKLHARATSRAPYIRIGRQLHRLAAKVKTRKLHAVNGNYLDSRKSNLLTVSSADVNILNRATPITQLVGVVRQVPPKWLRTQNINHAHIRIGKKKLHLGSFKTLEEAGCAYDKATRLLHGPAAVTNLSLGFITAEVAGSAVCRKAARAAKRKVREHKEKITRSHLKAYGEAKTPEAKLAAFKAMVARSGYAKAPVLRTDDTSTART